MAPPTRTRESYTRQEVRRMLGLSERRLRSWEKQDLAPAREEYTFADLVVLRSLIRLHSGGASPAKIRRAVAALRQRLGSLPEPLRDLRMFCENGRIAVQMGSSRMEALSGQLLLDFNHENLQALLAFPKQAAGDAVHAAEAARRFESSVWFEKALQMESSGAPLPDVVEAYEHALALDPRSAGAQVNLGTIYFHLKDYARAESFYAGALESDPRYPLAHFNLGNLYDERGEQSKALLHYTLAVRLDPAYGDAHYNLALLYQSSGQLMSAVRHWKAYLRIDPCSEWAVTARQELDRLREATVIEGARSRQGASGA